MNREQQRKEISRKICERCDYFDGHACTVNRTGECNLAKESAESILAMGYGNLKEFSELVLCFIDKEMANLKTGENASKKEGDNESAVLYQVRYWELHRLKEKIEATFKDKALDEIIIDGKSYTLKQLQRYIKFYNEHQIQAGQTQCPLCECDYDENGLFVCEECGNLLPKEEKCTEHHDGDICQECCDVCRRQKAFEDEVNLEIDRKRGK